MTHYKRSYEDTLSKRLAEKRKHIQVLFGPRQVGKTTIVQAVLRQYQGPQVYISADDPQLNDEKSLEQAWNQMRLLVHQQKKTGVLVIDEIHKFENWSAVVKARWDEDSNNKTKVHVIILGSAPLLIQKGLSDSLAGRFETIQIPHWSYHEMREAFGFSFHQYTYFGGYPGGASLINDETRWKNYIKNSLIETTISRDVLLMQRVDKPALLRRLFYLACEYSSQIVSYQKLVGQLQDAGNTTTLAHYLELLDAVGFIKGLKKFTGSQILTRSSSPKLQVYNTAIASAISEYSFKQVTKQPELFGRWAENVVGSHLLNSIANSNIEIFYWREGEFEVDFIVKHGSKFVALEVKSGSKNETLPGMQLFLKKYKPYKSYLIGNQGIGIEDFLLMKIEDLFE